ncbi:MULTISPECIES: hypothetical protein [Olivibacter]|uniref:Uncharacterized protein n=1 Tax=Olivibacter jilunii TaxID=985016 RepID=A0ABW6AYN5_9SPHI
MESIHLSEVYKEMDNCRYLSSKKTFSIKYLTADVTRETGGKWVFVERAQICGLPYNVKDNDMRGLVDLSTGIKTAIHNQLIYEFNQKKVFK